MTGRVVHGLSGLPLDARPSVVTIGKFDGVHRGHRAVIATLLEGAAAHPDARSVVVTFDRHPAELLAPDRAPTPLLSVAQKTEALVEAGVELVVVLPFTAELAALAPAQFVQQVLVDALGSAEVLVGSDFRFGARGAGTVATLRELGEQHGFVVGLVDDVCEVDGRRVSSTSIRQAIEAGRLEEATAALGRAPRIRSLVVPGYQRGREMGYPTANLAHDAEGLIPADGVYACWLSVEGERYGAAVSVGNNPTFGDVPEKTVEAHAIDVVVDLYGRTVELEFVAYIRGMQKFPSADALADQMGRDELEIRSVLGLPLPDAA
ncbi:bifunctional riboflavin kinase/FAD synthetase [Microcella daejeonensis]|uniref:Riboflavin biosynthesis protein n=1 Tax=Microcella daejeonensis TaxID=2994971 RepID=A0A9E8S8A8_9MICO|nr:bifunctional riboflavin kinase/FAD synthetase [Microcella daejeonensis]WAB81053.1 bifunctional riboflavin kinase/FAD synthetase [Microcella daejeonensis]